jgi:transcriptional regulator
LKSGQLAAGAQARRGGLSGMNTLTVEQQQRILSLLEDGKSLREIERITGHRRETISLYGRLAGLRPAKSTVSEQNALAA